MKRYLVIIVFIFAGMALAGCSDNGKALSVNGAQSNPSAYQGTVTIAGIVAGVSRQDPKVFALMDMAEAKCNKPGCEKILLPVRYEGDTPKPGTAVQVTGSFTPQWEYFAATKVKKKRM